jgi:serine/threonine-protein kinase MRCK
MLIIETPPFVPQLSGPEDTRYFEDEANESKKFVKKNFSKTKEFTGRSLAFVGYSYIHQSTAVIKFPCSNTNHCSNGSSAFATVEIENLKEELALLKKDSALDKSRIVDFEREIATFQTQKIIFEAENKKMKSLYERLMDEKDECAKMVTSLKDSLLDDSANLMKIEELTETKNKLEKKLNRTSTELLSQKEAIRRNELSLNELKTTKLALEQKITSLDESMSSIQRERDQMQEICKTLERNLFIANQSLSEIKNKLSKTAEDLSSKKIELDAKAESLGIKEKELDIQNMKIGDLEKEILSIKLDLEKEKTNVSELEQTNQRLIEDQGTIRGNYENNVIIEKLKKDVETAISIKNKLADEISALNKSAALLELEANFLKKKNQQLQIAYDDVLEKGINSSNKIEELEDIMEILREEKSKLVQENAFLSSEIKLLMTTNEELGLKGERNEQLLEEKLISLEQLHSAYEQLQFQQKLDQQLICELQSKIHSSMKIIEEERASRLDGEKENGQLKIEIETFRVQNLNYKAEYENFCQESFKQSTHLQDQLNEMETNYKILLANFTSEKDERLMVAEERDLINRKFEELSAQSRKENAQRHKLEEQLKLYNSMIMDVENNLAQERSRNAELSEKKFELESEITSLKKGSNSIKNRESKLVDKSSEKSNKGFRLSGMFFKSKTDINTLGQTFSVEESHEHNRSGTSGTNNSRMSYISHDSLANSLQTLLKGTHSLTGLIFLILDIEYFNPIDGLFGEIRVPKGGKVKRGWSVCFLAVVKNSLCTFPTEEAFLTGKERTLICNLSCEIFVARSVTQNEVIHANANEIERIFKIQSDNANDVNEIYDERNAKIKSLKESIELEEKMLEGVNKILSVTTDAQKVSVIGQIDAANKRIRAFKAELENVGKEQIGHSSV